ncbi:BsaA family SipW-dependent biofilm matrix protein [Enterococcus sp. AZ163]|uniref:BsaA family SipW-dependent biofilm matrix protein n=1 Tax=Enterococcus sp. AZ163 TaxID=2774638 RepID=UPI003D2A82C0
MSQKEKLRHLFRIFVRSKSLFACFSLLLSLLLVVGSTYAWITSSDERINQAEKNTRRLSAVIEEDFTEVFHWAPGTEQEKNIRVKNNGEFPAIVRVSLKEFFLGFETDVTDNHGIGDGNGNLKIYGQSSTTPVDVKNTSTWVIGNTYGRNATTYYKANLALLDQSYAYKGTRTKPLPAIVLNFQAGKVFDQIAPPSASEKDYWYYEDGYFYYSETLPPNDVTENLLDSVSLDAAYANRYKGALYKLVPEMDAHDQSQSLFSDWGIPAGSPIRTMYTLY